MNSNRIPQLDLLRGIAVLIVIAGHYPYFDFFGRIVGSGVDLFFVLSGFLVSGLLFAQWKRQGRLSIGRFYIRRSLKIYPAFYFFLFVTLPYAFSTLGTKSHLRSMLASECFFVQDYVPHIWGHTWSLGVEEKFYIVLPVLLLALSKIRPSNWDRGFALLPVLSVGTLVGCLAIRLLVHVKNCYTFVFPFHARADSLLLGVALGYWFHFRRASFHAFSRWWLLPTGLALLTPLMIYGHDFPLVLTLDSLGFGLLLCWLLPRNRVRLRLLEQVGFYSYSIYLWHLLVNVICVKLFPRNLAMFCVNLVASCVIGMLMAKAVEIPVLMFRDRLFPSSGDATQMPLHDISVTAKLSPILRRAESARSGQPGLIP